MARAGNASKERGNNGRKAEGLAPMGLCDVFAHQQARPVIEAQGRRTFAGCPCFLMDTSSPANWIHLSHDAEPDRKVTWYAAPTLTGTRSTLAYKCAQPRRSLHRSIPSTYKLCYQLRQVGVHSLPLSPAFLTLVYAAHCNRFAFVIPCQRTRGSIRLHPPVCRRLLLALGRRYARYDRPVHNAGTAARCDRPAVS